MEIEIQFIVDNEESFFRIQTSGHRQIRIEISKNFQLSDNCRPAPFFENSTESFGSKRIPTGFLNIFNVYFGEHK